MAKRSGVLTSRTPSKAAPAARRNRASGGTRSRASGGTVLGPNNYGKSRVRMVKVSRDARTRPPRHTVRELSVDIALEGTFDDIHTCGDNSLCLPTDTMKNTVYALGKDHPITTVESFALHLGRHFVSRNPQVSTARVRVAETPWERVSVRGREHPHCFLKGSSERQVCEVALGRRATRITGGIEGLVILKSTDSAFAGYVKDEFTTLPETDDRVFATSVTARWEFGSAKRPEQADFARCRTAIRRALIETFARHKSASVQHTLYAMAEAALEACGAIGSIHLSMPNKHCLLVNLAPFGMENANEVFVPIEEPHGLIEATVGRGGRSDGVTE